MNAIINFYQSFTTGITRYFEDIALLLLRLMGAKVFFESGLGKWNGWFDFNEQKYDLFLYEFFCPDPVREGALLLCDPELLDYKEGSSMITIIESFTVLAGVMEVVLPVLLMIGLFTRLGAFGLLGMTLFIQLAVFPTWDHWWNPAAWWAVVLFAIIARGPGILSVDRLIGLESGKRA
jgi:putative oxidoreductase